MIYVGTKLSKNFAWEANFFYRIRNFKDGLSAFELSLTADWFKNDHNPQCGLCLIILNVMIVEFNIFNVNHFPT